MSGASTGASLHTVSRGGVVAAHWLRRPEARHVIGAGSVIVTTRDGIGLRPGGFGPSRSPPCPRADLGVGPPACLRLAASILSLLTGSVRLPLEDLPIVPATPNLRYLKSRRAATQRHSNWALHIVPVDQFFKPP